jgi:hypothetical protein
VKCSNKNPRSQQEVYRHSNDTWINMDSLLSFWNLCLTFDFFCDMRDWVHCLGDQGDIGLVQSTQELEDFNGPVYVQQFEHTEEYDAICVG